MRVARQAVALGGFDAGSAVGQNRRELGGRPLSLLLAGVILSALAALAFAALPFSMMEGGRSAALRDGPRHSKAPTFSIGLAAAASSSIGASEHAFWAVGHQGALLTKGGGINTTFTPSGARLGVGDQTLGMQLAGLGRGADVMPVPAAGPTATRNAVRYEHGQVSEFYRNGPSGLEQGFTVRDRPQGHDGALTVALGLRGTLVPVQRGSGIAFTDRSGKTVFSYSQLSAVDASGRALPARMALSDGRLQLRVDDRNARYPVRIDPFIQQGPVLTGSGETATGFFGYSVALSSDGNTALVGGYNDNSGVGAVWVFTRSGSTWTQQGAKLTGGGETGAGFFGTGVALSEDGNTALIGGYKDNGSVGAAWVFTRVGGVWTQQGAKLIGTGGSGEREFGLRVALSADGNTALIGATEDNLLVGAAWVFTRSLGAWTQQGTKLTGVGELGHGGFGDSVALSSDGNTALIGGYRDPENSGNPGAAWVFTRTSGVWTQQGGKLTPTGASGAAGFGWSVALSGDGNTALIGGVLDNSRVGAAWVFTRSGGVWSQQGAKLTGSGTVGEANFGYFVALSADGNNALISTPADNTNIGAVWEFARSGGVWAQQGPKLTGAGEVGAGGFGVGVALSSDGGTALVGGYQNNSGQGAVWALVNPPSAVTLAASSIEQTEAVLHATVNPNGAAVGVCMVEYGLSTSYGHTAACASLPGSGVVSVPVSALAFGLTPNSEYHFRVAASDSGGTVQGADQTFTTPPEPPEVDPEEASSLSPTTAVINATVNPNGSLVTDCKFEWGLTATFGHTVACSPSPGSGVSGVAVSAALSGLSPHTEYFFRVVATNAGGISESEEVVFETLPNPPTVTAISPNAGLEAGGTLVTITGTEMAYVEKVKFGGGFATGLKHESPTVITAKAPAGTGTVHVILTDKGGSSTPTAADLFSYVAAGPAPTIGKLSAKKGPAGGGTSVTITGTGFIGVTAVSFGSTAAESYVVNSPTSITATSPAATTGPVEISIVTPNGPSGITIKDRFTYGSPTVTNVNPNSGPLIGGTAVTVTGTGFKVGSALTVFKFGKTAATGVNCTTTSSCTMTSPSATKLATVDVRATSNGKNSKKNPPADQFTYN
jgi:hypothetical protein